MSRGPRDLGEHWRWYEESTVISCVMMVLQMFLGNDMGLSRDCFAMSSELYYMLFWKNKRKAMHLKARSIDSY